MTEEAYRRATEIKKAISNMETTIRGLQSGSCETIIQNGRLLEGEEKAKVLRSSMAAIESDIEKLRQEFESL